MPVVRHSSLGKAYHEAYQDSDSDNEYDEVAAAKAQQRQRKSVDDICAICRHGASNDIEVGPLYRTTCGCSARYHMSCAQTWHDRARREATEFENHCACWWKVRMNCMVCARKVHIKQHLLPGDPWAVALYAASVVSVVSVSIFSMFIAWWIIDTLVVLHAFYVTTLEHSRYRLESWLFWLVANLLNFLVVVAVDGTVWRSGALRDGGQPSRYQAEALCAVSLSYVCAFNTALSITLYYADAQTVSACVHVVATAYRCVMAIVANQLWLRLVVRSVLVPGYFRGLLLDRGVCKMRYQLVLTRT